MRVLLAYDGSQGAEQALALAATLAWPPDSTLRIVAVADYPAVPIGRGAPLPSPELEAQIVSHFEDVMADGRQRLETAGVADHVEGAVLRGRPATAIVDEAVRFEADLVVGGSRGHGPIASLVLGSVSSEFVDHAPCPALVARTPSVTRSSSPPMVRMLRRWRKASLLPGPCSTIADRCGERRRRGRAVAHRDLTPHVFQVIASHAKDLAEARAVHSALAEEAAERLRAAAGRLNLAFVPETPRARSSRKPQRQGPTSS